MQSASRTGFIRTAGRNWPCQTSTEDGTAETLSFALTARWILRVGIQVVYLVHFMQLNDIVGDNLECRNSGLVILKLGSMINQTLTNSRDVPFVLDLCRLVSNAAPDKRIADLYFNLLDPHTFRNGYPPPFAVLLHLSQSS